VTWEERRIMHHCSEAAPTMYDTVKKKTAEARLLKMTGFYHYKINKLKSLKTITVLAG
jgi:hypothetical protein